MDVSRLQQALSIPGRTQTCFQYILIIITISSLFYVYHQIFKGNNMSVLSVHIYLQFYVYKMQVARVLIAEILFKIFCK